jgi:hypothetical protein
MTKNRNVLSFYKYWKKQYNSKKPLSIINKIRYKYRKVKDQMEITHVEFPSYIYEFLCSIKDKIEDKKSSTSQRKILEKYEDEKMFDDGIKKYLEESVKSYFNNDSDESDESDDSDESDESDESNESNESAITA